MMNVCFRKGRHYFYDELVDSPPNGIKYVVNKRASGVRKKTLMDKLKKRGFEIYRKINANTNAIPMNCKEDVIFSSGGVMIKSNKPWVTDFEHAYNLIGNMQNSKNISTIIEKTADFISNSNCKLLAWSKAAEKSAENLFGKQFEKIENKIEILYPAKEKTDEFIKKENDKIKFLFIGRYFRVKGGLETLMAFNNLTKKFDAELSVLSMTPENIRNKYSSNKNIDFIEHPIPYEDVVSLYKKSDILVMPTAFDTFGLVYLEAMKYSLPVIATNNFAVPEIVKDEKTGLVVEPELRLYGDNYLFNGYRTAKDFYADIENTVQHKLSNELEKAMIRLIENDDERKGFGKEGRKIIEKGKFSIKERNDKLKKVFSELIN